MSKPTKAYRYSVELNIFTVNAPGARLVSKGDVYLNICLLGVHQRTHLKTPSFPIHFNQTFFFDRLFKSCSSPRDIIQRLEREHVLIELLQTHIPSPVVLARYEISAKDFLHPYSYDRVQYTGLRRHVLLQRTIDFSGVSPSLEFIASPSVDDITGARKTIKHQTYVKPVNSRGRSPKRTKSPVWKPASSHPNRHAFSHSANLPSTVTAPTIASAVKSDYAKRSTQNKLRELATPGEVKYVVPIDKTGGREPFVVRHVNSDLIGRTPQSHVVMNDGLVVNDYSLSHSGSSMSFYLPYDDHKRPRSGSPLGHHRSTSRRRRARSASPSHRHVGPSHSADFEYQPRSRTPDGSNSAYPRTSCCLNDHGSHYPNHEIHSIDDCAICRLHNMHNEQSRRARSVDQPHFSTTSPYRHYSPDTYASSCSPCYTRTPALPRDSYEHRYQQSPAGELSDKIINTLRHNLDSYSTQPWHKYYSAYRYSDGHVDDNELLERGRRLTQY